jgi:hypothetical protein
MQDSMPHPLRKTKGKHGRWEVTGGAESPAAGIHVAPAQTMGKE